jgi:hypothetical protein
MSKRKEEAVGQHDFLQTKYDFFLLQILVLDHPERSILLCCKEEVAISSYLLPRAHSNIRMRHSIMVRWIIHISTAVSDCSIVLKSKQKGIRETKTRVRYCVLR